MGGCYQRAPTHISLNSSATFRNETDFIISSLQIRKLRLRTKYTSYYVAKLGPEPVSTCLQDI